MPVQVSLVDASNLTRSSATLTWTTSAPTSSQVDYGTVAVDTFHSALDPSLVTTHRVVLTGLLPGTPYRFRVRGAGATGVLALSPESTLQTAVAGSGPELADLALQRVSSTTATLGWATSTGTVAQVEYGTTANYGSFTLLKVFNGPAQSMTVTGLRPLTAYHFRVKGWDGTGALGASADAVFSTAPDSVATLVGDDTLQLERVALSGGQAAAYQYVASQSGLASLVRLYVEPGTTASVIRVALYSDDNGVPGSILSQGSVPGLVPGWVSVNLPPVPLLQSTRYWLAVLSPLGSGTLNLRQSPLGGSSIVSLQTSLAAFAQPFAVGASGARSPLSAYVQQVPPAITLTGPEDGTIVTGQVGLSASIDDDAPLARVQFLVDGLPVGQLLTSGAPYAVNWNSSTANPRLPHTVGVRATDVLGRSSTSGLVTVQVDNGPTISAVNVGRGLTATSARITWTTDLLSDGQIDYGPTPAYGLSTPVDARPDWRHDMQLTGLSPGAVYHYRVRSRDANGVLATSPDDIFFTQP